MRPEPLVVRDTWGRFDKLWWFGSTVFWGLPCAGFMAGFGAARVWWGFAVVGVLWIGFGVLNWHIRANDRGTLRAEVTAHGIRFADDQRPVPWSDIWWIGVRHTPSGTWGPPSHDYVVLHLKTGDHREHRVDVLLTRILPAISRLAPGVPLSKDNQPPPGVTGATSR